MAIAAMSMSNLCGLSKDYEVLGSALGSWLFAVGNVATVDFKAGLFSIFHPQ
jgi:hypothetical protein